MDCGTPFARHSLLFSGEVVLSHGQPVISVKSVIKNETGG